MAHTAYSKPPGDQFQQSTFRTEQSVAGLPSGSDREKEQVLPEGSATPKSVSKDGNPSDKGQGVGQRVLPYGTYNGPSSGSGTVEKSRTKPVPGDQYGTPSKDDYGYLTRRTMTGAVIEAMASDLIAVWSGESDIVAYRPRKRGPGSYTPHPFGWRRHRQKPQQRNLRRKQYRVRRSRELQQARRRYRTRYRMNPRYKQRRKLCRKYPNRCKMRPNPRRKEASIDVADAVPFLYGCDLNQGAVVDVTDDGRLVLELEDGTETVLTATAFVATAVFMDESDIDTVDYLVESTEVDEPYGEPTPEDVASASALHRVTVHEVGTPEEQLNAIFEAVMASCDGDTVTRVAHDTFLYDRTPASELSNNWLNRKEPTREVADTRPYKENAPGQWTRNRKDQTHEPSDGGYTDPNPTYYQGGSGKVIPDDMRLAAAWGRTLVGGVFQAPPGIVSAIESWAIPLYAGFLLERIQPRLDAMRRDPSADALAEIARVKARFMVDVDAQTNPGDTLIVSLPKVNPDGTVGTFNIGVRFWGRGLKGEPRYLLDYGDKKLIFRGRNTQTPYGRDTIERDVVQGYRSLIKQLEERASRRSESAAPSDDELLVETALLVAELRRHTDKAVSVKSVRSTDIPVDATTLSGWRYADRLPDPATVADRLRDAGLSSFRMELNFQPRQTVGGQWNRTDRILEVDVPVYRGSVYPTSVAEFRAGLDKFRGTVRHEVQHVGQDVLKAVLGLREQGGLPPGDIRNLKYDPSGMRPGLPPRFRQEHAERDIEFNTRLQDEIDDFVAVAVRIPLDQRRFVVDVWTGVKRGPSGVGGKVFTTREFFHALRVVQRPKWVRAVSEFIAGIEAAGVRIPPAGGLP